MSQWLNQCHFGDCLETLRRMPSGIAQTCVTSPPYFGLRDYGHVGQIGLEPTPDQFIAKLVEVFREVKRVLAEDGTLWLNIGDSYVANRGNTAEKPGFDKKAKQGSGGIAVGRARIGGNGLKDKDLIGVPWMLAFALRADGWYLRQEIIWHKPNPMPESVTDRCTKSHESIFLLAKSEKYYFDNGAIKEPAAPGSIARWNQDIEGQIGSDRVPGKTNGNMKAVGGPRSPDVFEPHSKCKKYDTCRKEHVCFDAWNCASGPEVSDGRKALRSDIESRHRSSIPGGQSLQADPDGTRNKRSVWTVATTPYKGAHFATFPTALIEPCILAGAPAGGVVIDPFFGSGTTGQVAQTLGRQFIGCELNESYKPLQDERLQQPSFQFLEAA